MTIDIQVDPSGCSLGVIDIKPKFAFYYKGQLLKCNLCFDVNKTKGTT